jgi:hypothetical protein
MTIPYAGKEVVNSALREKSGKGSDRRLVQCRNGFKGQKLHEADSVIVSDLI